MRMFTAEVVHNDDSELVQKCATEIPGCKRAFRHRRQHQRGRTVRLQGSGPREGETWTLVREDNRRGGRNGGRRRPQGRRQNEQDA